MNGARLRNRPPRAGRRLVAALALLAISSCASAPRPPVLGQALQVSQGPKATEAKRGAPQAFAHAEKLRERAEAAHEAGDPAAAQILAERSIAAYSHAFVLVRLARAEDRLAKAKLELGTAQAELTKLDTQHSEVAREAEALELALKVARDAVPRTPSEPATPEREAARLATARALSSQARLLCVSTWMLQPARPGIKARIDQVEALVSKLDGTPKPVPIDDAITARAACLSELTSVRRARSLVAPASAIQDVLLKALSDRGGLEPRRDDQGVVVTLRGLYGGGKLTADARARLEALAKVAKAHPEFPVLVVVHDTASETRAAELAALLKELGAPKAEARGVGDKLPLVPRGARGSAARNTRVELIFVSPLN